ncbi:MAG: YggS family pyridoxal phosphate-dependent enzyme [Clostridia bacterium]|nr:YggS family pyridoxal phosphate-dependent enzyme [Clostridia bacterium]
MADTELLARRLQCIREELQSASGGRYPAPKLIAVTKTHPAEEILPLHGLGISEIGENRVQEIMEKRAGLERKFQIHLIGRLQSNKVKYIIEDVCLIHSLDRLSLAAEIDRQAHRAGRIMPVLVQVSPAGEEQKGGMPPEEVIPFLEKVREMDGLSVRGLMAVMPLSQDEAYLNGLFADMRSLFERVRDTALDGISMEELSMGMSGDYKLAAKNGATMVRIGSALLGQRNYR